MSGKASMFVHEELIHHPVSMEGSEISEGRKRIFVSGQIDEKEQIRSIYGAIKAAGHSVTHDWTLTDDIGDKLGDIEESGRRAKLDICGVADCDAYILMTDNQRVGKGMYVELGAAPALNPTAGRPDVYVAGPLNHLSIFYLHPAVRRVESIDAAIAWLSTC